MATESDANPAGPAQLPGPAIDRRALGSGAVLAAGSQLTIAAALGITSVVVARLLGPGGTGAYSVVSSGLILLITATTLGLGVGITYTVSNERWPAREALRQSQPAALALGICGVAVGLGLALLLRHSVLKEVPLGTAAIAIAILPFALSWTFSWSVALGADRYEWYAAATAGQALVALLAVSVLAALFDLRGAVAGLAVSYVLAALAVLVGLGRRLGARGAVTGPTRPRLGEAAHFGLRAYLWTSVTYLSLRADLFTLSAFAPAAEVGHYAIALALTELVLLLPRSLAAVVMPRVAALDAAPGEDEYQRLVMTKSIRHSIVAAGLAAVVLAAATPLVPVVYGSDFGATVLLTLLLLPGAAALGASASLNSATAGKGKPEYGLYGALVATVPSVGVYLLVIPAYGATGAAIASSGSYLALALASLYFFRRATGIRDLRALMPGRSELRDYRAALGGLRGAG